MQVRVPNPDTCQEFDGSNSSIYIIKNNRLEIVPSDKNVQIINTHFLPVMKEYISQSRNIYAASWGDALDKAQSWIERGSTNEIPKNLELFDQWKLRSNNSKDWERAKRDPTLIVVSPYSIGNITVTCTPSKNDVVRSPSFAYAFVTFAQFNAPVVENGPAKGLYSRGGYYLEATRAYMRVWWDAIDRTWEGPSVRPDIVSYIRSITHDNFCVDTGLVTSTVSSADTACMDVLTAVAELPETAKSVLSGFKMVYSAIKDLKKGRISISKAHERQKKSFVDSHRSTMSQLQLKLKQSERAGERRHWERKISQENKRYVTTRQRAAAELADALASIWMNFRYNIMPMVYTVEDLIDLVDSYFALFKTVRDKTSNSFQLELEGWTGSHDVGLRHTCVIKRLIDPNVRFSSLTKANLLSTAWELIPLSFVVDWFINIGDLISAVTSPNLSLREGATYAWKVDESFTFTKEDNESELNIKIQVFERRVIDPMSHIGVSFNSQLSLFQKIDSLALLWNPVKALLIKSKRI